MLGGILGGKQGTFARYGLSEEFTAVYRLHSLLPDELVILEAGGANVTSVPLARTRFTAVPKLLREHGFEKLAASFGVQQPGQLGALLPTPPLHCTSKLWGSSPCPLTWPPPAPIHLRSQQQLPDDAARRAVPRHACDGPRSPRPPT